MHPVPPTPSPSDRDPLLPSRTQENEPHLPDHIPPTHLLMTMSTLWLNTFLAALDATVIATLSGPIASTFHSGTLFSWIASGYLIANAAIQPLSGKLTDIYGRRAGLIFASSFFALGTMICGIANAGWGVVVGRVVAGMGGGVLNTISTFVGSDLIPLRRRGVWQGFGNVVFGMGMGAGGVFGGAVSDTWGWRWVFWTQVPLIVVAGGVGVWVVDVPTRTSSVPKLQRVDFLGAITLVTSLVLFLFGLNSGGNTLPWTHPLVPTSLILGGFTLLAFVYVESRAAEPILPPRLLTHRTILSSCLANWFVSMSVYILIYYTPIYTHVVLDFTPTASGGLFIPQAAGSAFGSLAAGLIMKASGRYRLLNLASQTLNLAACAAILATFTSTVPTPLPFIFLFIMGVGYGATLTVTLIAMISATEHRNQAVVTSASYAFRSTGASVGICLAGAVFQNLVWGLLVERFGEGELVERVREGVGDLGGLTEGEREGVRLAFVGALRGVWAVALGLAAAGAGVSLGIGEHVLFGDLERRDT